MFCDGCITCITTNQALRDNLKIDKDSNMSIEIVLDGTAHAKTSDKEETQLVTIMSTNSSKLSN